MGIYWINELSGGQNQHTSPALIANNESELLYNVSQSQDGSISNRLGSELFLNSVSASAQVRGLHMFQKNDGTNYFHMVSGGNLYVNGASTWSTQQSSAFNSASEIDMANYIGRHYLASSNATEYLSYVTESGSKSVVSGDIEGKYLAVNGAYLVVAGGTTNPRRTYFSNVDSDTFTTTTDYFITSVPPTGVAAFGNGRPFIIFTQDNYMVADPATLYTNVFEGFGCVSHRSIQSVRGNLIWLGRDAFYMLNSTSAYPIEISLPLLNDVTGDAIFNKIDGANWSVTASGVDRYKYYCALRSLSASVKGQTINYCVVEYDLAQQTWRVHSYSTNTLATVFANFTNSSGVKNLYAGSVTKGAVFKFNSPGTSTDDDSADTPTAITAVVNTKHYEFGTGEKGQIGLKKVNTIHFRYKAANAITVSVSIDGASTYTSTYTLPAASTNRWVWDHIDLGEECKSISLSYTTTGAFTVFGVGFEAVSQDNYGQKGV